MPFNYQPRSQEEDLLEPGEYDGEIVSASPKKSKRSGDAMLELVVKIFGSHGRRMDVYDYLVASEKAAWKIRNFCASAGLNYDAGEIDEHALDNASVRVMLGKETAQGGYPAKNKILDYLPRDPSKAPPPSRTAPPAEFQASDDDVPF